MLAGLGFLSALTGQIIVVPLALIPLAAGIGILRRRAWSAWGYAAFQFAQFLLLPMALLRGGGIGIVQAVVGGVVQVVLIPLFFFAGRALAAAGFKRGWSWPWITVAAVSVLPLFFVQACVIPTGSMEDTLLIGDRILVQRFPRPTPMRGELIAFRYPPDPRQTHIKRIVGMPGDRIRLSHKTLYRNGAALYEPYVVHKTSYEDSYRDNFPSESNVHLYASGEDMLRNDVVNGEVVVPDRKYFVLGDNRDSSLDSRYWGFVSSDDLIGRPLLIDDSEEQQGTGWRTRVRWKRLLKRF